MNLSTLEIIELAILTATSFYDQVASYQENQQSPAGKITTTDRSRVHWLEKGHGETTIVIDHSLGGVEGYLLIDRLATLGRVVIFDGRDRLKQVKRSFYRTSHWFTMAREITSLDTSARQLRVANDLENLPVINIKADTFLRIPLPQMFWGWLMNSADRARDQIHLDLAKVSTNSQQLLAQQSSHFVWIDRPDVMVAAVEQMIEMSNSGD
jgi:hypothetical protein